MATMTALNQVSVRIAPARRLTQLAAGLWLYGASMAMQIRATLGLDPWDVLHEGLTKRTGLSFGLITAITGVVVLLAWIPLRQKPGVGTIANVVLIAVSVDVSLAIIPAPQELLPRIVLLVLGIVLNAVAFAAYVGSRLGPGPRDGMVTGFCRRTGISLRLTRTVIELLVLATGWLLGGTVGIGTILYALGIGPLSQLFLPMLTWRERSQPAS
ncbi:membrane protein [Lentzea aerocolonigenes]|uniref:Membrane protein n=1 Tax=Lentzea aerocolonigenes TaxID=68170 RepID=A0A0F0HBD9_LENAE|nr:membrane protein [Lentzea aerocolonigenes]KJK52959.1 membrane protein [Lentzea aerocolonigenes]